MCESEYERENHNELERLIERVKEREREGTIMRVIEREKKRLSDRENFVRERGERK